MIRDLLHAQSVRQSQGGKETLAPGRRTFGISICLMGMYGFGIVLSVFFTDNNLDQT